jgi:hypothetical protein
MISFPFSPEMLLSSLFPVKISPYLSLPVIFSIEVILEASLFPKPSSTTVDVDKFTSTPCNIPLSLKEIVSIPSPPS